MEFQVSFSKAKLFGGACDSWVLRKTMAVDGNGMEEKSSRVNAQEL